MSHRLAEHFRTVKNTVRDGQDRLLPRAPRATTPKTPKETGVIGVLGVEPPTGPSKDVSVPSHLSTPFPNKPDSASPSAEVAYPKPFEILLAGRECRVRFWRGEVLAGQELALDTETELIEGQEIPHLAMATASTADEHYIIHPDDLVSFLERHRMARWIFFNVAFDFWVLHKHAVRGGSSDTVSLLWEKAARGELHDTMLLDSLVTLARQGVAVRRNLAEAAAVWAGIPDLDKDDPYRLRYGEILGKDWHDVESGFFSYAIKDAIATFLTDRALRPLARQLTQARRAWLWPGALDRFGPLSETVQVKGAIALAAAGRSGLRIDRTAVTNLSANLAAKMRTLEKMLLEAATNPALVKRRKTGEIVRTKSGLPSFKRRVLQGILEQILADPRAAGLKPVPRLADGTLSQAEDCWEPYMPIFAFVAAWLGLLRCGKLRQFTILPRGERVHPRYHVLKLTGRTSAEGPNLQQVPRKGGGRECFVPSLGHYFLIIDFSYIELVTLAAICEQRYGRSKLAKIIRRGIDPHCFTVSLITGMTLEAFMDLKKTDPNRYKELRQKAKALNFGIPGGLGAARLMEYAQANYGVTLTLEQATGWRDKVIKDIYPELGQYLADRTMAALAANLGTTEDALWDALDEQGRRPGWLPVCVRKILSGVRTKADGCPYHPAFLDSVWAGLVRACRRPEWIPALSTRRAEPGLTALCNETAVTPTGRLRANVKYTEARNTPFQGLASDGAKLACFELVRAGYRLVGFVHDEKIIELPVDADHAQEARRIKQIVCDSMAEAVNRSVPVSAEYALMRRWYKGAKMLIQDGKLLPVKPVAASGGRVEWVEDAVDNAAGLVLVS